MAAAILIVEDHHALAVALAATAERCGLRATLAPTLARAREILGREEFAGLLLDIGLPDGHGLELVERWEWPQKPEIAVITAHGEIENAIAARKLGIARFFDKPVDFEELQGYLHTLTVRAGPPPEPAPANPSAFVGASPAMRTVFRQIAHACASDQPVVIRGDTGTGKSHVARLIQQSTQPSAPPLVAHASSRMTDRELAGLLDQAKGRTLVIESIGTLTTPVQAELVRSLDRLADEAPRLVVTTGGDGLLKEVTEGRFNQDLYYRLQILEVILPPLVERLDDIPALCACFLGELDSSTASRLDDEVLDLFADYDWPGNLRELRNVINYALVTSAGTPLVTRDHVPEHLVSPPGPHTRDDALTHALDHWIDRRMDGDITYKELNAELEALLLRLLLRRFDDKPSHLAAALSINRSTLRKRLRHDGG